MRTRWLFLLLIGSLALNLTFMGTWAVKQFTIAHGEEDRQQSKDVQDREIWCPLHRKLGVSKEQWQRIEPKMREFQSKISEQRRKMQGLRLEMLDILAAPQVDKEAVEKQQERIIHAVRGMQDIVLDHMLTEKSLLTENQTREMFDMLRSRMEIGAGKGCPGKNATKREMPGGILKNLRE